MDIKWINTLNSRSPQGQTAGRRQTGGTIRALAGFLAFFLGLSLFLGGACALAGRLSSANGRRWLSDSRQADYQNTRQFRAYISDTLETLLTMGVNGPVYGWYGNSSDYEAAVEGGYITSFAQSDVYAYTWTEKSGLSPQDAAQRDQAYLRQAQAVHARMQEDKNLLYRVDAGGVELYSNYDGDTGLPEGYNFLLTYRDGKVTITKDGQELDVYGDGYYTEDSDWYLPGYRNFTVDEAAAQVEITMAVLQEPQLFVRGNYQTYGYAQQNNQLYWMRNNLLQEGRQFQNNRVLLGAGLLLLLVSLPLRRDRNRANQAVARATGRVWFELKLLLFLVLLFCLLPHSEYLTGLIQEVTYAYNDTGYDVSMVVGETGWILEAYLAELSRYTLRLLSIFWSFWLLVFNDWRYNKKPWRNGVFGMLWARGLDKPVEKRLSRMAGLTALTALLLAALAANLIVYASYGVTALHLASAWILCLPPLLGAVILAAYVHRQRRLWTDLGALVNQIAAVRTGSLDHPLILGEGGDLAQAADDLNHIQQGLHTAVDERTRSERMKVELLTNVSHDLKTPLTSIISYTELLEQEALEPPAGEYVKILGEKAQRLKAMVQDVFEVSKAASGQLPVKPKELDLARLLRQTLADMDQPIRDSGLTLRTDLPDQPVPITADSDRIYRVFQNLMSNALKYSLPGSRVYLTLTAEGGQAVAALKNTSAAELRPGVDYTERFVRGDESRTDGGAGLGLSIAASFVRACGGQFRVETQADLFTALVTFPIQQDQGD